MVTKQVGALARTMVVVYVALGGAAVRAQVWPAGNQLLHQVPIESAGFFGSSLAVGDFNGDGRDDLAVGEPGADLSDSPEQGRVTVYASSPTMRGFSAFHTWSSFVEASSVWTGWSLIAGDFDGVPPDELVVGLPFHDDGGWQDGGAVAILWYGSPPTQELLAPSQLGLTSPETDAHYGKVFAVGDFNADGFDDLAVGIPDHDAGVSQNAGALDVFYGTSSGLDASFAVSYFYGGLAATGVPRGGDELGRSLAAGDFDGDGFDDLAIGVPGRQLGAVDAAGEVLVVYGSATGLDPGAHPQRFDNASIGLTIEQDDGFGEVLAAGDFNGPGFFPCVFLACADDLAIGTPGEDIGAIPGAGNLVVLFGVEGSGLSASSPQILDQGSFGYNVENVDRFASFLATARLGSLTSSVPFAAADDLLIGVPLENVGSLVDAGVAHLVPGSSAGLSPAGSQLQAAYGGYPVGPPMAAELFGDVMAAGDFDGDGDGDVAFGLPSHDFGGAFGGGGAVQVLYGGLCSDGFERGDTSAWRQSP